MLNNPISNAPELSHGGTTARVRLTRTGEWVTVAAQDQGPGIPAAELHKLFQQPSKTGVRSTAGGAADLAWQVCGSGPGTWVTLMSKDMGDSFRPGRGAEAVCYGDGLAPKTSRE